MQKQQGHAVGNMALYFGARYEATEFLYGDEIEAYAATQLSAVATFARSCAAYHRCFLPSLPSKAEPSASLPSSPVPATTPMASSRT